MKLKNFLLMFICFYVLGCSGISMIGSRKDLYSTDFTKKIEVIKKTYRQGNAEGALKSLKNIPEEGLLPTEKALRRNLMGVIAFSKGNFEQAIFNFDLALSTSRLDVSLTSQINLNLASTYYKLGFMDKASTTLSRIDNRTLHSAEAKKLFKLSYKVFKELGNDKKIIESLVGLLREKNNLSELKSEPHFEILMSYFFKLSDNEKVRVFEDNLELAPLTVGYLAYLEAEKKYYKGDKDHATDILEWVEKKIENKVEIQSLVKNFFFRVENYAKMDISSIGVILPLTGKKNGFGKRALLGIDNSIKNLNSDKFNVYIKDSEGSGAVGRFRVRELIEKHFVSVIIGGLFSHEATKEYLEAKKHGVFFISLSQIYLPKEQKDHLLLEIPGSIESQINHLFSAPLVNHFGNKAAIIYPKSARGEAYVNEFWRKSKIEGVKVTSVQSYEKNKTDYREPVQNMLGLKYVRERQEEHDIMRDVFDLTKNRSIRRIQVLKPQIDFDWIFVPSFPKEALQIIPSFTYFDAFRLNIIGGPSWRSRALSRESHKLVNLYFVGDDVGNMSETFTNKFVSRYKKKPRVIEMLGHDAFNIVSSVLNDSSFKTRSELDIHIRSKENLKGMTGEWNLENGIWIKKIAAHKLKRGRIEKLRIVETESI